MSLGHAPDPAKTSLVNTEIGTTAGQTSVMGGRETVTGQTETGSLTLAALKKKKTGKKGGSSLFGGEKEWEIPGNEELKALEAHMMKLSKQGGCLCNFVFN